MIQALPINAVMDVHSTREGWLAARKSMIGASESAAIFGVGYANQSPITVWNSKTGGPELEIEPAALKRMDRGRKLEPIIAAEFADETGLIVEDPGDFTIFRHPELDWLGATLDRIVIHDDYGPMPVEIKSVNGRFRNDWNEDDEPPLKYMVQVQHQMAVTGASHAYLVGLIGGDELVIRLIERNQRFIDAMLARLAEFWQYVLARTMPPVDESEATRAMLGLIYPRDTGEEITLPDDFIELDRELLDVKEQIKTLETREKAIENRIKAAIGDATRGVLPVGSYTWKQQNRTTIDAELLRSELPEIADQFSKTTSFRVLRRSKS